MSDGWLCFARSIILTVQQNDCVKRKKYLVKPVYRPSDWDEYQDHNYESKISPLPPLPPQKRKKLFRGLDQEKSPAEAGGVKKIPAS